MHRLFNAEWLREMREHQEDIRTLKDLAAIDRDLLTGEDREVRLSGLPDVARGEVGRGHGHPLRGQDPQSGKGAGATDASGAAAAN